MNFEFSEEQQQFADSVKKLLGSRYTFEQRKAILRSAQGIDSELWQTLADLGLMALSVPEADGGFGGTAIDLMGAMQACGEALVVEPVLDNIGLAGRLVARAGSPAQRAQWLPGLLDGSVRLAFANYEPGCRYALEPTLTSATAKADSTGNKGWVLQGAKCVVIGAPVAHQLIVSAATPGGVSLFLLDPTAAGVHLNPSRTADGQSCADVVLEQVQLGPESLLGEEGQALALIEEAVDFASALLCADAVGAMSDANEATLAYLKTRKQFGVPIGSFQVLQHRMVEMTIACEQARSMAILAASKVDAGVSVAERQRVVSMAMVKIADSARQISQESVQLHGGMGMTEELKISHTFRRLTMIGQRFGDADHHLERYAGLQSHAAV